MRFSPSEVVLCCFSLQGVPGRRAAFQDQGRRVNYLIGVNGAVAAQEMIRNAAGGVDYIAQRASGKHIGTAAILGINIDGDPTASLEIAFEVAPQFGLKAADAKRIAAEVGAATARWGTVAARFGIAASEIERMRSAFEHYDFRTAETLSK